MNSGYEKVPERELGDHEDNSISEANETPSYSSRRRHLGHWCTRLTLLNLLLFVSSATLCGITYLDRPVTDNQALRKVLHYTPLLDKIEFQFVKKEVEGTLFDEETLSKEELLLRSHSNDASDAAWEALSTIERVPMSAEEVRGLGKDPETAVRIPAEYGFGENTYAVQLDSQHNLHCLDTVRKYAYREYYFPDAADTGNRTSPLPWIHQAHLTHCISILRQVLTCNPSLDVLTHNWMRTQLYPPPDFAVNRKCIKHDRILEWQARNAVPKATWWEIGEHGPSKGESEIEPPTKLLEWTLKFNT